MADTEGDGARIWPEIRRISESLVRLETKIDEIPAKLTDHEVRIRKLEERRYPIAPIAAVLALIASSVAIYNLITLH